MEPGPGQLLGAGSEGFEVRSSVRYRDCHCMGGAQWGADGSGRGFQSRQCDQRPPADLRAELGEPAQAAVGSRDGRSGELFPPGGLKGRQKGMWRWRGRGEGTDCRTPQPFLPPSPPIGQTQLEGK